MAKQKDAKKDTVWVGPELPNGHRPMIRRTVSGESQKGLIVPLEEANSVLELDHLEGPFYQVTGETRLTASGPSQVASKAYRDGWSRIFGGKHSVGQA